MNTVESFERLMALGPESAQCDLLLPGDVRDDGGRHPGDDPPARQRHIRYVHFRDVAGTPESFVETFHDNGPTDMAGGRRCGRTGRSASTEPARPDHVPVYVGEEGSRGTRCWGGSLRTATFAA